MNFIQKPPKINLHVLRERLFSLLQVSRYADNSINTYRKIFNLLEAYLSEKECDYYDSSIGKDFLASCKKYRGKNIDEKRRTTDTALTLIKCLDSIVLFDQLRPPITEKMFPCPDCFKVIYDEYIDSLRKKGRKPGTIELHSRYASVFLAEFAKNATSLKDLDFAFIQSYLKTIVSSENAVHHLSAFLQYAYNKGLTSVDFSYYIHPLAVEKKLPSVYTKDEIQKLLGCIDRNTTKGKRDYAITILAYRLGLRASDIISLRFENIDFINEKISIVQKKTGVPLNLPLLPEVRCALSDYISARPCSQYSEIFLNTKAPFTPMKRGSESSQIADYFRRASFGNDGRKIGLHSLRATLATELVAENVSYAVTQKILGHVDSSSIQHYVKLDVEMLRSCSIAVPQPSGNFQKMLLAEVSENG